jgi:hypothetical protein
MRSVGPDLPAPSPRPRRLHLPQRRTRHPQPTERTSLRLPYALAHELAAPHRHLPRIPRGAAASTRIRLAPREIHTTAG